MKKQLLTLIAAITLFTAHATDRLVHELGLDGAYTTISAAIAASSAGDRFLVYPKALVAAYVENVNETSKSLQIISAVEGKKFHITGNVTFQTSPLFQGAWVTGNIIPYSAYANDVHIVGCRINGNIV